MAVLGTESTARQATVLVIDHAPACRDALRSLLQERGYNAIAAGSGEEGLDLAVRAQPDLVLLELALPGIDGLETCRRLKANPATSTIPVIFVSSRAGTDDIVAGFEAGASDYVTKPARVAELCARLRAQLQSKRSAWALECAAMADPLTLIPNRRQFDRFLEKEWQRALRSGAPLSLLMLDVDHFKLYNDTLGHAAGDACLQQVAGVLQRHAARATDLAARYGGEEFVLLFGETPAEAAARLAEAVRADVESLHISNPRSPTSNWVTVSIGVASVLPSRHASLCGLLLAADRRLYEAKRAGRNRVVATAPVEVAEPG
ncbi:diguanylate cyclase [Massilia agilis]|uniref:diguanylate cyclase n=1 Tax=Massilia agilis TaxID=1811226 RepID=A0ABT2D6F2_9BURK|nr:diguanylate cyclase [Massilia agilis]MCS0806885.1 diguanylate cyclase [Massilia agilis]